MRPSRCAVLVLLLAAGAAEAGGQSAKPNIIVIVSDDHGYAEMTCQGGNIPTPNMDAIAKNGVRFTNGYVSCPVCSPTRAGLITGRYQQRFGHEFNPGPDATAGENVGLPLTEVTLADRLKAAGYATGMVGKWHLGYAAPFHPMKRGFDEFFGFLGGAHPYLPRAAGRLLRGTQPVEEKEYLTEAFAREAAAYVKRQKDKAFFLYLTFNAVHNPLQAPEKLLKRFESIADEKRRTFAAMLTALDDAVGAVLGAVREAGLEERTLVFFVADNGGPTRQTSSRNDPLRAQKGQVYEGGTRVPFMAQWKGTLPAGKVYDRPVIALDIHPTALAAAGAPAGPEAKLDGVDLLPYLKGHGAEPPHDRLFWRFGDQWAIRMGDWKLVHPQGGTPELYNLAEDAGEKNSLIASKPEKAKELQAAYDAWNAQLAKPLWGRARRP